MCSDAEQPLVGTATSPRFKQLCHVHRRQFIGQAYRISKATTPRISSRCRVPSVRDKKTVEVQCQYLNIHYPDIRLHNVHKLRNIRF